MELVKRTKLLEENPDPSKNLRGQAPAPGLPNPFLYLPPEIIYSIFTHVTDPTSLINCCAASPHLSSLLHRRKTTFLFPSLLPLIYGPGKDRISPKYLLVLRLVCKTWKDSIDTFIQNHPTKKAYSSDYHLSQLSLSPSLSKQYNYYFDPYTVSRFAFQVNLSPDNQSLSRFRQEYNQVAVTAPQSNPFVGRSLILSLSMDANIFDHELITRYVGSLILFIEQFGRHIYHLTLRISQNSVLAYCIFRNFDVSFLQFLPNLRSLSIHTVHIFPLLREDLLRRLGPGRFRDIPELYPMTHLESISVFYGNPQPEVITTLLFEPYLVKLTRVSVPSWVDGLENKLPNLKELTLSWLSCNRDLERLSEVEAGNLEKLRLQFRWKRVSVKTLHGCLLKFRNSLKCLELDWCGNEVEAEGKALLMRGGLPKGNEMLEGVHTLKVSHALGVDYSFLRWLPGLQSLYLGEILVGREEGVGILERPRGRMKNILERMVEREGKGGGVEIHKYLWDYENMHKCNVWKICKGLKMIKFNRFRMREATGGEGVRFQEGVEIAWKKGDLNGKEKGEGEDQAMSL